jgi:hypothetical protein
MICPLCHHEKVDLYEKVRNRTYYQCYFCYLVFVPRTELISFHLEKERYENHHNSEENSDYVKYLEAIAEKISSKVIRGSTGLDFGCGESLLMEKILDQLGFSVSSYDLFFHANESVFDKKYDFILLSEVIEHLRDPYEELRKINGLLRKNGSLFIKTKLLTNEVTDFKNWFYRRDITHIQFFSEKSFSRLDHLFRFEFQGKIGEDLFQFRHN